jgi:hypothetical protein
MSAGVGTGGIKTYRFVLPFLLPKPILLLGRATGATFGSWDGLIVREIHVLRVIDGRKRTKDGSGSLGGGSLGCAGNGIQLGLLWNGLMGKTHEQEGALPFARVALPCPTIS